MKDMFFMLPLSLSSLDVTTSSCATRATVVNFVCDAKIRHAHARPYSAKNGRSGIPYLGMMGSPDMQSLGRQSMLLHRVDTPHDQLIPYAQGEIYV